jgi:hypothetical protein
MVHIVQRRLIRVRRWETLLELDWLTCPDHLSSFSVLCWICLAQSSLLCNVLLTFVCISVRFRSAIVFACHCFPALVFACRCCPAIVFAYRCCPALVFACHCCPALVFACRFRSAIVFACRCCSAIVFACRFRSALIFAYRCCPALVFACRCCPTLVFACRFRSAIVFACRCCPALVFNCRFRSVIAFACRLIFSIFFYVVAASFIHGQLKLPPCRKSDKLYHIKLNRVQFVTKYGIIYVCWNFITLHYSIIVYKFLLY